MLGVYDSGIRAIALALALSHRCQRLPSAMLLPVSGPADLNDQTPFLSATPLLGLAIAVQATPRAPSQSTYANGKFW